SDASLCWPADRAVRVKNTPQDGAPLFAGPELQARRDRSFDYLKDVLLRVATHSQRLIYELTPNPGPEPSADTRRRNASKPSSSRTHCQERRERLVFGNVG